MFLILLLLTIKQIPVRDIIILEINKYFLILFISGFIIIYVILLKKIYINVLIDIVIINMNRDILISIIPIFLYSFV